MKNTIDKLMMLVVILALAVTACTARQDTGTQDEVPADVVPSTIGIVAEGSIRPVHAVNLSFLARGVVEQVTVEIGDSVNEGDVLARLSNAGLAEAQLAAANLELLNAQQALDALVRTGDQNLARTWTAYLDAQVIRAEAERAWEDLNLDNIQDRIDDAESDVLDLENDLQDAQEEFDRYKDLSEDNPRRSTAEDDLERAQEQYNEAVRRLEEITRERDTVRAALDAAISSETESRYQWEQSADGVNADQLALAQARLKNAQAQVAAADASLSNYILTAPFDGVVMDVAVSVGEQAGPESRALSIADPSAWVIETNDITELEVVDVEVGQPVAFTADALPDVEMSGVVGEISRSSFMQSGDVIFTVRIQVDEVDPRVRWGMTVEVTFEPLE